jgi:hypothetical protein
MTIDPAPGGQGASNQGSGHQVYGRPTLGELVGAVREALTDATAAGGPPLSGFRARVAANALAMAERELARGEADQRAYAAALARLGAAGEAELAAGIRAGHRDHQLGEIAREFRVIVAARLAVAHPGYDTPGGGGHAAPALWGTGLMRYWPYAVLALCGTGLMRYWPYAAPPSSSLARRASSSRKRASGCRARRRTAR